jgi:hypothetical protein
MRVAGLTVLPEDSDKRLRIREGYDLFNILRSSKIVDVTMLLDNMGPFAKANTLEIQDTFLVTTQVGPSAVAGSRRKQSGW